MWSLVVPKAHGAWAMIVVPMVLGIAASRFDGLQVLLCAGILLGYMAGSVLLEQSHVHASAQRLRYRSWAVVYGLLSAAMLALPVFHRPGLLLIGASAGLALPIDLLFLAKRRERSLVNGLVSIAALTTSGLATYLLGQGVLDARAWLLWAVCLLQFAGSLLFVKSMIRDRSKVRSWLLSIGFHLALVLGFAGAGRSLLSLAYLPGLLRAAVLARSRLRPLQIGMIELANSLYFLVLAILAL